MLKDRIKNPKFVVLSENATYIERYAANAGIELEALNKWRQIHRTLYALSSSDLFIIGGGVPFYDKLSHAIVCAFFVIVAKIFGCHVMTYAVATQTLNKKLNRFLYRNILENLDLVTVRDPLTLRIFQNIGVKRKIILTADPGLMLASVDKTRIDEILMKEGLNENKAHLLIGISIRNLSLKHSIGSEHYRQLTHKDILQYQKAMIDAADFLTTLGQVVFIPMHTVAPDDDREIAKVIISKMKLSSKVKMISDQYSPAEVMGIVSRFSLLLGTRLHSVIFAAACSVPFVTIAYDLKLMGIAESFKMENHALDLIGIDSDILKSKLDQVWKERDKIKNDLNQRITELKKLVDLNADLAVELCVNNYNK